MGAFKGNLSYKQYYVVDPLPEDWRPRFEEQIRRTVFKEIDIDGTAEESVGWCSPHFPLDLDLSPAVYQHNEYLTLAVRFDKLTVPGAQLRLYVEAEVRKYLAESHRDRIGRQLRDEIKERVRQQLRRRILPVISAVDMVWNVTAGVVRYWSHANRRNELFVELFEDTFGLLLVPDSPYAAAVYGKLGLDDTLLGALATVEPAVLADAGRAAPEIRR
ncbi:MAG: recombination-associated protein RdgC [Candidatus Schekmanbacteria bacterium]|nr:recombination-associated protein RdgC [Candidatus Schekmanbacteria bacterium]